MLQVSDQGGGIPRSLSERMFHYMYSTAPQPSKSDAHTVPLAGKYFKIINYKFVCLIDIYKLQGMVMDCPFLDCMPDICMVI